MTLASSRLGRLVLGRARLGTSTPPIPPTAPPPPNAYVPPEPQNWHLYVRDASRARVAEIDDFSRLDLVLRFNDVGGWVLDLPPDSDEAALLSEPKAGIVCVRNGEVVLSGPATGWDFNEQADEAPVLTVSGLDDNIWLRRRVCLPSSAPYSGSAYDVQTGAGETVMRHYVSRNLGPDAETLRQLAGLSMLTDLGQGASITGRARFDNLLELLQGLALAAGTLFDDSGPTSGTADGGATGQRSELGFRIIQHGSTLQWQVYQPRDLTRSIEFSYDRGNMLAATFSQSAAEANYEIAGGGGQGTSRVFREHGDDASISRYERSERFLDERGTSDHDELDQSIDEDLASSAEQVSLTCLLEDTDGIQFIRDWKLGDRVRARVRGIEVQDIIREVEITLTGEDGETVSTTVGTPGSSAPHAEALFGRRATTRLARRIGNIERSE